MMNLIEKEEKKTLLDLAKYTVETYLKSGNLDKIKAQAVEKYDITENLKAKRGVFVTLRKKGDLRGCIGYIDPIKPLYLAVIENAVHAAFSDFRFHSVQADELRDITIEISVLTPIEPLNDIESIKVGRDGLIVKKGYRQGLLLPQVATEYGWDRYQFLSHTCMKAGLPKDEWKKEGLEIHRFGSLVFSEEDFAL